MILTLTCLLGCNIIKHVLKIKPKCNLSEMRRTRKGEDEGVEGKQKREDVHQAFKNASPIFILLLLWRPTCLLFILKCFAQTHSYIVVNVTT